MIQSMRKISIETGYTYGKRRLKHYLNTKGYQIGIYAVASLMKRANIKAIRPKKRHYYPDTGALHKTTNNLLDHDFNQQKSNTHWVGDITYIKTYQGWSYLASVLNLASRQVVGWALSKHPNAKLAQDALANAINRYKPNTKYLMFHSDQGTQYSSKVFIDYCSKNNITQSMGRKGNCWDNAVMERFFINLKAERLNYQSFANHFEVVQTVESYIYFYNYKRIHSAIGYLISVQKMAELGKVA
jgi:transposase InsO family protein